VPQMGGTGAAGATWGERLLDGMTSGDWINAGLLAAAIATLFWSALSLRRQAQASDFRSYLQLTERYADAWRKFRDVEDGPVKDFEFGEILNLIEGTCQLYDAGAIRGATRDMIRDYLREVLPAVFRDEYARARIVRSFSGPDTYFHIRRFARRNSIKGVPHQ
jgi:hypothetical protein